ncbi:MAG: ArsA family ATPase [Chloroflexi bacterium]|nr:ArsA family ATPase [Chloroflexota bacterium]
MRLRDRVAGQGDSPHFVFFSGKGGVGKTTLSSATAVWLAEHGERVLHVSTDLQKSLNDIYQQEIGGEPTPIEGVPKLWAVSVETAESMERHRGKLMQTLSLLDPDSSMLQQMKDDPATDCGCAQAAVFEFMEYLHTAAYDAVVFDTAPAGSTLEKIETQSRSILALTKQIEMKRQLDQLFGDDGLRAQIAALEQIREGDEGAFAMLRSTRTAFTLVVTPEALPFAELQRNAADLEGRYGIPIVGVVINSVLPETERDSNAFWRKHWTMQARYIHQVHAEFGDRSIASVPLLATEAVGLTQLRHVASIVYDDGVAQESEVQVADDPVGVGVSKHRFFQHG